jgi:hypothetical protein
MRYKYKGKSCPSVTEVLDLMGWNKKHLIDWTSYCLKSGKDPKKIKDDAATFGTEVHDMIEKFVKGESVPTPSSFKVELAFNKFLESFNADGIEVLSVENEIITELNGHPIGGTFDLLYGDIVLVDWKTSNNLHTEYVLQLSAYKTMYEQEKSVHIGRMELVHITVGKSTLYDVTSMYDLGIRSFNNALDSYCFKKQVDKAWKKVYIEKEDEEEV